MKKFVSKQKLSMLMVFVLMVFAFSACQAPASSSTETEKQTTTEKASVETTVSESTAAETTTVAEKELKPIKIILDWLPNTNHTGLYVAKDLGYFEKAGFAVEIMQPPEGSTTQLVGAGGGELGISFQDTLAKNFVSNTPLPVTAIATILQHNTSGVISLAEAGIDSPAKMSGKRYSTWDDPIELAILEKMVNDDGGDFSTVELVPFGTDVISALNTDSDSAWVYYAWDGVAIKMKGYNPNFLAFSDYIEEADYYTPVIIANNDWLSNNSDDAKALVKAIVEGYEYAAEHPEESADILLANAPEIDKELAYASQEWISEQYIDEGVPFGYIDAARWDNFYQWLFDNGLIEKEIPDGFGFSNDYLPEQ